MAFQVYTCDPEHQQALLLELKTTFPGSRFETSSPGWVGAHLKGDDADRATRPVAFSSQVLPTPASLQAPSISRWAECVAPQLAAIPEGSRWRLTVFGVEYPGSPVRAARAERIRAALLEELRKRNRGLLKELSEETCRPAEVTEWRVILGLETESKGWLSVLEPALVERWSRLLCPAAVALLPAVSDLNAPSRAHLKLIEGERLAPISITSKVECVDLGASPGGWTWVAVQRGALVTAVDRSPLRQDLMGHRRVRFVKGDAFRYEPSQPVEWLLCDVIAFPNRTLELLQEWLERGWCRRFCVTFKFRGQEDYPSLEAIKRMLDAHADWYLLRSLPSNRNEVTAVGVGKSIGCSSISEAQNH